MLSVDRTAAALSDAFARQCFSGDVFESVLHDAPPLLPSVALVTPTKATHEGAGESPKWVRLESGVYDLDIEDAVTRTELARRYRSEVRLDDGPGALLIDRNGLIGRKGARYRLRATRRPNLYGADRYVGLPFDAEIVVRCKALDQFVRSKARREVAEGRGPSVQLPAATTTKDAVTKGADDAATCLAAWLRVKMQERNNMTPYGLQKQGGPDPGTTRGILNGRARRVTQRTRQKLAAGLSSNATPVSVHDIPS